MSEEANAISTTYRRLKALDEPESTAMRLAFLPYVMAREAFSDAATREQMLRAEARTNAAEAQFWSQLISVVEARDFSARPLLDAATFSSCMTASARTGSPMSVASIEPSARSIAAIDGLRSAIA